MSRTDTEIQNVVASALQRIAPDANVANIAPTANIREALEIDSYDFLQFLIALNKQLGVDVPEADYGKLQTLNDLTAYLRAHSGDVKNNLKAQS
jgi:acyl carrier protein